jgi:hypothetical protein
MIWLIPVGAVVLAVIAAIVWFSIAILSEVAVDLEPEAER